MKKYFVLISFLILLIPVLGQFLCPEDVREKVNSEDGFYPLTLSYSVTTEDNKEVSRWTFMMLPTSLDYPAVLFVEKNQNADIDIDVSAPSSFNEVKEMPFSYFLVIFIVLSALITPLKQLGSK